MKSYKRYLPIFLFFFLPVVVFGQTTIENPLGHDTFADLINAIVVFVRTVALFVAPIVFIVAGFMYYTAGGNPEQAKKATDLIKYAVVGLVIILIANGITYLIADIMGVPAPEEGNY